MSYTAKAILADGTEVIIYDYETRREAQAAIDKFKVRYDCKSLSIDINC